MYFGLARDIHLLHWNELSHWSDESTEAFSFRFYPQWSEDLSKQTKNTIIHKAPNVDSELAG